jgi:hypothetical protein
MSDNSKEFLTRIGKDFESKLDTLHDSSSYILTEETQSSLQEFEYDLNPIEKAIIEAQLYLDEQTVRVKLDEIKSNIDDTNVEWLQLQDTLDHLELVYEDNIDRESEYPAAQEILKKLRTIIENSKTNNAKLSDAWTLVKERMKGFTEQLLTKNNDDDYTALSIFNDISEQIANRIPRYYQSQYIASEAEAPSYIKEGQLPTEEIRALLPPEKGRQWREQLLEALDKKGETIEDAFKLLEINNPVLCDILQGERIEIVSAGGEDVVSINIINPQLIPHINITPGGNIFTSLDKDEKDPKSLEDINNIRAITSNEWEAMITAVIDEVQKD